MLSDDAVLMYIQKKEKKQEQQYTADPLCSGVMAYAYDVCL